MNLNAVDQTLAHLHPVTVPERSEEGMCDWIEAHEYVSVRQRQGSMSQRQCPDPEAFERSQYMRTLQSYKLM